MNPTEAVQENEERYRLLIEHSRDLICEIGREGNDRGRFLYLSPNYPLVVGYKPEELLRTNAFDLVHPDDLPAIEEKFALDAPYATFRHRHKNGSWRWVEVSGKVFKTPFGEERSVVILRDITERKQAEELLRESQASLAMAQHIMRVGSWELELDDLDDINKNPLRWSDEVFRIFGHAPGGIEVSNENFFRAVHPDDRALVAEAISSALKNRTLYSIDHRIVLPNGTERVVHEESKTVFDEQTGRPLRMLGVVQDITERNHVEVALRESQARWRTLVENVPDIIMTLDREGTILFINRVLEGFTRGQVLGANALDFLPEDQRANSIQRLEHLFETGQHIYCQMPGPGANREPAWYSCRIGPVRDGDKIVAVLLIATDITEQKIAEESLRESEARFRQIAENIEEVFWMVDFPAKSRMIYVSPAYEKIWGCTCKSLYENPESFLNAVHPDDRERVASACARQAEEKYDEIYRLLRPDGTTRWIRDRAFPIHNEAGEIYRIVGLAEDITERKQIELQFFQSQKMEAFGKLAGGVAHDFNNLLTVIGGYNEIVLSAFGPNDPRRDFVEEIAKAAERASSLTRQLLAFSRQQVMQPKIINLNEVLGNVEKMLRRLIGEDIALITQPASDLECVKADPGQLENVLMNLAVNARDAMPGGGTLTISTQNTGLLLDAAGVSMGRHVMLSVADTGVGMPDHIKAQIFEPFFTTKPIGHGTGLGLATCYGIVKQSGGFINVESKIGKGTTFKIHLPCVNGTIEENSSIPGRAGMPKGNETLLFVEDEPNVRRLAVSVLQRLGYRVLEASDGEEACRIMESQPVPHLDLVITDVVMPQMGGRELVLSLRKTFPDVKVLFTSGYPNHAFDDAGLLDDKSVFMAKPFAPKRLALQVRELLDK